jgi:hypothetical protein
VVVLEPTPPATQRLGVMQAQDLDVGDPQPGAFDRWHDSDSAGA